MAELTKKLNVKKSGAAAEEIKLYSTLDEVANKGVHIKSDGINCYAAYGNADDAKASQLNYKPSGSSTSYKVLKEAASTSSGDGITITLKARRNNEDFMQDLPPVKLDPGQKFYLNNANAPTIEGYDFVCCSVNNFVPTEDQEINVYYIPQTVPDRTKTDWSDYDKDATGDLSLTDYANTYAATNMSNMLSSSTITGAPKLNISNVEDANYMFSFCKALTSLNASSWDTSNVTSMIYTFAFCSSLTSLDVSNWDTSKVTNMSDIFSHCLKITSLDVSNWDTSNVTNMGDVFSNCSKIMSLDVSNWDTSNVTSMSSMFSTCSALTSLDVSNWNTSKVTSMNTMFAFCSSLTSLDVSNWDTSNVTSMSLTFTFCSALTSLNVSNWDTSKVTSMNTMFSNCKALTTIIGTIDMSSCTNCNKMFDGCPNLTDVHLRNVPRSLDMSSIGGTEGTTYIIDNYLD